MGKIYQNIVSINLKDDMRLIVDTVIFHKIALGSNWNVYKDPDGKLIYEDQNDFQSYYSYYDVTDLNHVIYLGKSDKFLDTGIDGGSSFVIDYVGKILSEEETLEIIRWDGLSGKDS